MGIGHNAFKIWLTTSLVWIIAIGIMVYAGGIFPADYKANFSLRSGLEPWQSEWPTSGSLRHPLYEIIRSPSAEKLALQFQLRWYQGALWNQHVHSRELPHYKFPSGETLDLPADLTAADLEYVKQEFWDQRWKRWLETLGPYIQTAIYLPLGVFAVLWVVRRFRGKISGKEIKPDAPRLPYSPAMEWLRNVTLAASGAEILLWLFIGFLNQEEDPQSLFDAASIMLIVMLPALAALIMSLLRRGPLTAAVLAGLSLFMLLPQLMARIL